ncbi:MAG: hypothetical protein HY741_29490 [Chloroflexi bacterium]|nr:hypothetical protein [Chloroflexota bacterium]
MIQTMRRAMQLFGLLLAAIALSAASASTIPRVHAAASIAALDNSITLVPDQLTLSGDAATQANTIGQCTEGWLSNMPPGSIILGVDPTSCNPADWDGGSAQATVSLPDPFAKTVWVLKLSWLDNNGNFLAGKGLHSPDQNRAATITFDGQTVWGKRTTQQSTFGDYYAAEFEPIMMTLMTTQAADHTLTISVPPRTAWDLSEIKLIAYPYPSTIRGIGYSPYRDCQFPHDPPMAEPTIADLQEDLTRLVHTTNAIRTYAAGGINGKIPGLANQIGLPVYAGAWIDYPHNQTTKKQDRREIKNLIALAKTTKLEGVIVGNEYYLRNRTDAAISYLGAKIDAVHRALAGFDIPITTAEIDGVMFDIDHSKINPKYKPILDRVNFVLVHIYPFWNGESIEGAAAQTVNRYKTIQTIIANAYPGQNKRVIIGETGWPSGGAPRGNAAPSLDNQLKYLLEFVRLAEQQGVEYMYFDAFDELWKIEEPGGVGQHWGYSYTDRMAKYPFYGILIPSEELPSTRLIVAQQAIQTASGEKTAASFPVFTEWPTGAAGFVPSGWMGDIKNISMYECDRSDPHSGEMAVRASFSPEGALGWAGVYWQHPENNWGDKKQGVDLRGMDKLTFWAKGVVGGEKIRFFVGGIGTKKDPYPDSLRPQVSSGFLQLKPEWRQYTINLRGQDLSHVIGGFGWATDKCANPSGATFYLDDILFERDPNLPPPPKPGPTFPVYTEAAAQDNHYVPSGWMGDGTVAGRMSLSECWTDNPYSGKTAIRIAYTKEAIGWAGIYWVHPAENWGDRPGGIDLRGAKRLTFWAKSDTQDARVKFIVGGVGYPNGTDCEHPSEPYPDSVCPKIEKEFALGPTWKKYTIKLPQGRNLNRVVGGFGWVSEKPVTFYLDDIVYEFN